jgi:uncharacterized protein DUF1963
MPPRADRPLPGGMLLERTLRKRGIREDVATVLTDLARPALRYRGEPARSGLPLGASRTGGEPDLPPDLPWPAKDGSPLSFVAQIDLEEAARCAIVIPELPRRGFLAVFHDCLRAGPAFSSAFGGSRVLHFDVPRSSLRRLVIPEDVPENARFPARGLKPYATMSLPSEFERVVETLALGPRERTAYETLHDEIGLGGDFVPDQLGGWPAPIQHGPYSDGGEKEWALILQIGSEVFAYPDGMFEALYVSARTEDILTSRFDRAWCLFETA